MKILNFGSCNIDFVYKLDHIVTIGETETSNSMQVFPGGKGLNQSVALAKAGMEVYHAGCIGTDGEMLTDVLESNGVDISNIKKVDEKTGHAVIQVSRNGDNSIFLYSGSNAKITEEFVDEVLDKFQKGDMLLLQNEINKIDYIIEKAYKKGMCIIFNPSPYNDEIKNLDFNMLSYIIIQNLKSLLLSEVKEVCTVIPKRLFFSRHLRSKPLIQPPRGIRLQDTSLHKQQWGTLLKNP